jgi:hypothetical protein
MLRTVKATIDRRGKVKLAEAVSLNGTKPALVTILDDEEPGDAAILAESSLSEGWAGPREDKAWKHLVDLPDLDKGKK